MKARIHFSQRRPSQKRCPVTFSRRNLGEATVFQLDPPCGAVTWEDIHDIYPICKSIKDPKQREACFAVYGMDMTRVEKYYAFAYELEKQYEKQVQEERMKQSTCIKLGILNIFFHKNI